MKPRKREFLLAFGIGAAAAFAVIGVISDGFGGPGSWFADPPPAVRATASD